jgi:4'-phosphopantetheinyl transferase
VTALGLSERGLAAPGLAGPALAEAAVASGTTRLAGRNVHWRFGWADDDAADPSRRARVWLEDIVTGHDLFPWRGLERAVAWTKPRFADISDADFSISHSGRAVLVAVACGPGLAMPGSGVGADIEIAPYRAFTAGPLLRRMCAPEEHGRLAVLPPGDRRRHAVALWTAKEAAVKATGRGLADDFRTFALDPAPAPASASCSAHLAIATDGVVAVQHLDLLASAADGIPSPTLSVRTAR